MKWNTNKANCRKKWAEFWSLPFKFEIFLSPEQCCLQEMSNTTNYVLHLSLFIYVRGKGSTTYPTTTVIFLCVYLLIYNVFLFNSLRAAWWSTVAKTVYLGKTVQLWLIIVRVTTLAGTQEGTQDSGGDLIRLNSLNSHSSPSPPFLQWTQCARWVPGPSAGG